LDSFPDSLPSCLKYMNIRGISRLYAQSYSIDWRYRRPGCPCQCRCPQCILNKNMNF
jgi:hypothetical protein